MEPDLKNDLLWTLCDILESVDLGPAEVAEIDDLIKRIMETKTNDDA